MSSIVTNGIIAITAGLAMSAGLMTENRQIEPDQEKSDHRHTTESQWTSAAEPKPDSIDLVSPTAVDLSDSQVDMLMALPGFTVDQERLGDPRFQAGSVAVSPRPDGMQSNQ